MPSSSAPPSLDVAAKPGLSVLVVDDEKNIRATLALCLEQVGGRVTAVGTGAAALAALERDHYDAAFLDLRLGDENGLDVLPTLLAAQASLAVVVITAYATFDTAVEAIKRGAPRSARRRGGSVPA